MAKQEMVETVEKVPPAPSETVEETVKVGRRSLSQHAADRATRFDSRQTLHDAYGTTSGRKGERASTGRSSAEE